MRKFFVETNQVNNNQIQIIGEDVNHIKNVLRLEIGEQIKICDKKTSTNYISEISEITNKYVKYDMEYITYLNRNV